MGNGCMCVCVDIELYCAVLRCAVLVCECATVVGGVIDLRWSHVERK